MWTLNRGGNEYPIVPNQRCERFKLHANGRNIVSQQLPTLVAVTCCVRLLTLLYVVAQNLKPVKLLVTCKRTQRVVASFVRFFMSIASF